MGVEGSRGNARPPIGVTLAKVVKVKWGYHARRPYRQREIKFGVGRRGLF